MPSALVIARLTLPFVLAAVFSGMVAAQVWAFTRSRTGRPVWPEPRPHAPAAWGVGSVALVVVSYLFVQLLVSQAYLRVRDDLPLARAVPVAVPPAKADAGKPPEAPKRGGDPPPAPPAGSKKEAGDPELTFSERLLLVSFINLLIVPLVPGLLHLTTGPGWRTLGIHSTRPWEDMKAGAAAFFLVTPWVYGVNAVAQQFFQSNRHPLEQMMRQELTPFTAGLALVSAVVLAPLAEEQIFRGVLQGWLARLASRPDGPPAETAEASEDLSHVPEDLSHVPAAELLDDPAAKIPTVADGQPLKTEPTLRRPSRMPLVATSLAFAALHAPEMPAPFAIFVLSLALGVLKERTGSLVASVTLHALFNGFSNLLLFTALTAPPRF